jgi:hypothetical protein
VTIFKVALGNQVVRCYCLPNQRVICELHSLGCAPFKVSVQAFCTNIFRLPPLCAGECTKTCAPRFRISKTLSELTADTSDQPTRGYESVPRRVHWRYRATRR